MGRAVHLLYVFEFLLAFIFGFSFSFEIRADSSLLRCNTTKPIANITAEIIHKVKNCRQKLHLQVTAINSDKTPDEVEFVFIEDAFDDETGIALKLLNPLVVRFHQEQVLLAYPLKYISAVNARASEVIINYENKKNYTGCDDESPINPTCGIKHEWGGPVEYSQGFCCFCPEAPTSKKHTRGGQDCSLKNAPSSNIDLAAYKASAHCLKKSGIWYTVNALEEPVIMHQVYLRVYALRSYPNGSSSWIPLSGDEDFSLGAQNSFQYDDNKTIAMTYVTEKPIKDAVTIDYSQNRLLIPQPMLDVAPENYPPPIKKGPSDYLILNKSFINADGDTCNTAGVSYSAFALQDKRCDVPAKTCLKNQPWDFWESDNAKRESGGKGKHLLQFYGTPFKDPIMVSKETDEHWLVLEYYKTHRTVVYVEVKSDDIIALKPGRNSQILTIVSVAQPHSIEFHVTIHNSGLASAIFTIQVLNCSYNVPSTAPESRVIAAQLKEYFVVSTKPANIQLVEKFTCKVHVNNSLYGIVAKRKVVVKPKSRCICYLHCRCVCLGESLKCEPMTQADYHAAGFKGSLPVLIARPPYRPWATRHPWVAFLAFLLFLLMLGAIKGTIGFAGHEKIGEMGYKYALYKPGKIQKYPFIELELCKVIYDPDGFPLHPDTRKRLKTYKPSKLFLLNLFICFIYPFFYIWLLWSKKKRRDALAKQHMGRSASEMDRELSNAFDEEFEGLDHDWYEGPIKDLADMERSSIPHISVQTAPKGPIYVPPPVVPTLLSAPGKGRGIKVAPPVVPPRPGKGQEAKGLPSTDEPGEHQHHDIQPSHAKDQDRYRFSYGFHRDDALDYETVGHDPEGLEKFKEKANMVQHIVHN